MGIVLEPLSPAGPSAVAVTDGLLGIGRDSQPFSTLAPAAVAGLAAQHGYIFREQDKFFLMAISGNTLHNGVAVPAGQPIELAPGDELGFGDVLRFRVVADARSEQAVPDSALRVSLIPTDTAEGSETLVLENFPFLVSREALVFLQYATTVTSALKALSRRHAFLHVRNDNLYVKDLGSTNGTRINERLIDPYREVRVQSGDVIAFGSRGLGYTVELTPLADEELARTLEMRAAAKEDPTSGMQRIGNTVYIRTADSFLDIFLDSPAGESPPDDDPARPATKNKPIGRTRALIGGLREALGDDRPSRSARRWVVPAGIAVLVLAGGGGYYLYDTPQREIAGLLAQQDYRTGLLRAADYRNRYPNDPELEALATEALSKWLLPVWLEVLRDGRFDAAEALLEDTRVGTLLFPENERILDLLGWMTDLERFIDERGGSDAPLVLFRDEPIVLALLEYWDADAGRFDLLLVRLAHHVPAFQNQRSRALSQLRGLRNDRVVYLQALDELRRTLDRQLAAGDTDGAMLQLAHFERQYPRITGLDALRTDIAGLEGLRKALANRDIDALLALSETDFETPWVRELAAGTLTPRIPAPPILARYRQALEAWRDGDAEQTTVLLRALNGQEEAAYFTDRLRHFERVAGFMERLPEVRRQADYGERLLAFTRTLDRDRDRYFLDLLSDDLRQQRGALLTEIESLLEQAREHWNTYRDTGGISGLMRLEETVTDPFREQSRRLLTAYRAIDDAIRRYEWLRQPPTGNALELHRSILGEVRMQRQSFTDLGLVMEPTLLQNKLQLLPNPGSPES